MCVCVSHDCLFKGFTGFILVTSSPLLLFPLCQRNHCSWFTNIRLHLRKRRREVVYFLWPFQHTGLFCILQVSAFAQNCCRVHLQIAAALWLLHICLKWINGKSLAMENQGGAFLHRILTWVHAGNRSPSCCCFMRHFMTVTGNELTCHPQYLQ